MNQPDQIEIEMEINLIDIAHKIITHNLVILSGGIILAILVIHTAS